MSIYEVEYLLARRTNPRTGKLEYKVKWVDYPKSQSTWEPLSHLEYVPQIIQQFDRKLDGRPYKQQSQVVLKVQQAASLKQQSSFYSIKECSECDSYPSKSKGKSESRMLMDSHKKIRKGRPNKRQSVEENIWQNNSTIIQNDKTQAPQNIENIAESAVHQKPNQKEFELQQPSVHEQEDISVISQYSENVECAVEESDYRIMEMTRNGTNLMYLVEDRSRPKWHTRNQVLRVHKQALIDFYEERLSIICEGSFQ